MSLQDSLRRILAGKEQAPVTVAGAGNNILSNAAPDVSNITSLYGSNSVAAQIIDIYTSHITQAGWVVETDKGEESLASEVSSELERMNIDSWMQVIIQQSLIYGYGVCEIVPDSTGIPVRIIPRKSEQFGLTLDTRGMLESYYQSSGFEKKRIDIGRILWATPLPSIDNYGVSLIRRAAKEIYRDDTISEGIALAIKRHGTGKHVHKLGNETHPPKKDSVHKYRAELDKLSFNSDIIVPYFVDVEEIDRSQMDVTPHAIYATKRMCSAMGMPPELIGIRDGTTDNTAVARIKAFYVRIGAMQNLIARQITDQLISQLIPDGKYAAFRLNKAAATEWSEKAKTITELMKANPLNPFWPGEAWIKSELSIPIEDLGDWGG